MIMQDTCFFDLETTGTDKSTDRIVEIAIAKVVDGAVVDKFHSLVNPQMAIPQGASDIHGITNEKVAGQPTFKDIAEDIIEFIDGHHLAGYNSNSFDIPILYMELQRAGFELALCGIHFIDVCNIFRRKEERTLSAAVKFYTGGSHENAHSAMDDVLATIDVFQAQLQRYEDLKTMDAADLGTYCNYDQVRCDLSGNFQLDKDNDYVFSFGKHKGQKAKNQPDYLMWMLRQDFLPDTKNIIKSLL
jgi:DNA polymerase-3 subunit epsilon